MLSGSKMHEDDFGSSQTKLGICVVTYQESFCETVAFESLSSLPFQLKQSLVVVSTQNAAPENASLGWFDIDDNLDIPYKEGVFAENSGLSGGYNRCLEQVGRSDVSGVLFLNADSKVTEEYVKWLISNLGDGGSESVFAPKLSSCDRTVSPFSKAGFNFPFFIIGFLCLKRGSFLNNLVFPDNFWLDGIDYWLSAELYRAGAIVKNLDFVIEHNLSVSDQFKTLPLWRYKNILVSERLFYSQEKANVIYLYYVYLRSACKCIVSARWDLFAQVLKEFRVALLNE